MNINVVGFTPVKRNTLTGFATVDFTDFGYEMQGFAIHENESNRWVDLPAKPPSNPEKSSVWPKVIEFYDRRKEKQFKLMVLVELDKYLNSNNDSLNDDLN